ncbi:DUF302 domain-containing protein [Kamptonema cortianum]|nr:DUF302 domain-containing protein [Geitlerinema splendidum]MDK3158766.1 DUF302 domain-containing protein [Kamptonema cortianum]
MKSSVANSSIGAIVAGLAIASAHLPQSHGQHTRPPMEFEVESKLGFAETVQAIQDAAVAEKYTVLHVHKMSETLESKGFPREPVTIVEICNAKAASTALANDMRAGLMMPCPVMVYAKGDQVFVMTYDTRIISQFFEGGKSMEEMGETVYGSLTKILNSVKK